MGGFELIVMFQIWPLTKWMIEIEIVGSEVMISRFANDRNWELLVGSRLFISMSLLFDLFMFLFIYGLLICGFDVIFLDLIFISIGLLIDLWV